MRAERIIKDYLALEKKESSYPVLLSQRRAEAFCEEYNLIEAEEKQLLRLFSLFEEVAVTPPFSLASLELDYKRAKAVSFDNARSSIWDALVDERKQGVINIAPVDTLFINFLTIEREEQRITLSILLLQEEEITWKDLYTSNYQLLEGWEPDCFLFSHLFVTVAERIKGEKIKTAKELLSFTGYDRYEYLEEETLSPELLDTGGLFHTAGLFRYRKEIKRKMRRGASYKELLSVKPSSFFLPTDLSKVDSVYNGSYYDGERIKESTAFAWSSKEEIVAALICDNLLGGESTDKNNRGYLIELYSKALGLTFEELLSIRESTNTF
jgi:hypothetical protein